MEAYTLENAEKEAKECAKKFGGMWTVIQNHIRTDTYDYVKDCNVHRTDTVISTFYYGNNK
jgi:hypothetical protein